MFQPVPTCDWGTAIEEFLLHVEATRATNTRTFYDVQLRSLRNWAESEGIAFGDFRKKHLDRFTVFRTNQGMKPTTVHHGAACAKKLFRWCTSNQLLDRDPLSEYRVRNAPYPARPMPTDEDVKALLKGLDEYWDVRKRPGVKLMVPERRTFHRERNTAILLGLLDTACRIGEMLSLRLDDYQESERRILVRVTKGRQPRTLPVSPLWADALAGWLRVRRKVMAGQPDEGLLFVSENGGPIEPAKFFHNLRRIATFAGITGGINLHSLRRYSINKLAKVNLLAAQAIAGHSDTKTTLLYTKLDPDFLRDVHAEVGVLKGLVTSKRSTRKLV